MKINKLLGAAMVVGITALSAATAYAADSFVVGKPVDLATGNAVTNYEAGQHIAIPVDFIADEGAVYGFQTVVKYDTSVLSPTFKKSALSTTEAANLADPDIIDLSAGDGLVKNGNTYQYINNFVYEDDGDLFPVSWGAGLYNASYDTDKVFLSLSSATAVSLSDKPELYLLFTVNAAPTTEDLNVVVAELVTDDSMINSKGASDYNLPATTEATANACAGAFMLNIDSSKLENYIQALYAKIGDNAPVKIEYYSVSGTVYSFPVRVILENGSGDSVDVKILADTSSDLAGAKDKVEKASLGTVTVALDSPVGYEDKALN